MQVRLAKEFTRNTVAVKMLHV